MKTLTKVCAGALLAFGMAYNAQAILITAGTTPALATGNETSTSAILAIIQASPYNVGSELYKQDTPGSESGGFASSYSTVKNSDPALANDDFTITHTGGAFINLSSVYLLVKDGSQTPAWYLYNISGWNGTEIIQGQNFWPAQGGISHISIYGSGTPSVPDGGSMLALLGGSVTLLGFLRRKISA